MNKNVSNKNQFNENLELLNDYPFQRLNNLLKGIESPIDKKVSIEKAVKCLKVGGRLGIITFHSLEDRIVKNKFRELEKGCTCPPTIPICICGKKPQVKRITKKPICATGDELDYNNRAHSAKLRVIEKI